MTSDCERQTKGTVSMTDTTDFLRLLYGDQPLGVIGVAVIKTKGSPPMTGWATTIDEAADLAARLDRDYEPFGVYVRPTTLEQPPSMGGRGTEAESYAIGSLWADLDIRHEAHRQKGADRLPPDEDEARRIVEVSGLPEPSVWVRTGHGLNAFWSLAPELIADRGLDYWAGLSRRWHRTLAQAAESMGYLYKPEADLSKILRAPGSINRKIINAPKPCEVVR